MRRILTPLVMLLIANLALAHTPIHKQPLMAGNEVINSPIVLPPYNPPPNRGSDLIVGDTMTVGTTWYDYQHNGSISRMIALSPDGYIQMVWMKGLDPASNERHVFYNYIEPNWGAQGYPQVGVQVDNATRGGYTTLALDSTGVAVASYHYVTDNGNTATAVSYDLFAHSGNFQAAYPDQYDEEWIWPHIGIDRQERVHVLATGYTSSQVMYCRGTYDPSSYSLIFPPGPDNWTFIDTSEVIGPHVAASSVSDRVCLAWSHPRGLDYGTPLSQENNDFYYLLAEDGISFSFDNPTNLTNFLPPDLSYLPDTLIADMDTFRVYSDVHAFFDQADWLHCAFTTQGFYELEGTASYGPSLIWHWSEEYPTEFQLVANGWIEGVDPGAWQLNAQRPSLGQDPNTGYLYCTYHVFDQDPAHRNYGNRPSGEVYISVSTNGGLDWSVGTNITNTLTPNQADTAASLSETFPSMAQIVDGYCHILYLMDHDAGANVQGEGAAWLCEVKYHRVSVGDIPTTPTMGHEIPFHVSTVGIQPPGNQVQTAKVFALKQNYPNPFNPTTAITFSLDKMGEVSLDVYNLKGEIVARLASGTYGVGAHTVTFDGSNLASGIYIYRLKAGERTLENKMLLLK